MAKRFITIDFLRGLAIFMMVFIHTIMRWLDRDPILNSLDTQQVFFIFVLLTMVFFGAWAGFFLLVSSIANMISMNNSLDKGQSWKQLMYRQVMSGVILLVFSFLIEGPFGYHGWLGNHLVDGNWSNIADILSRGYQMETIATIAWCMIVNGIVQALLCRNGGFQKPQRNIKIYAILAIIVVAITLPLWNSVNYYLPQYPDGINPLTGVIYEYGYIGKSSPWELIYLIFLAPIAGSPEPLLPFLAVSFVGSMIGIWLCQPQPDRRFIRKSLKISAIMFFGGLIATAIVIFTGSGTMMSTFLGNFYSIRSLYIYNGTGLDSFNGLWIWWFICLTGAQIGAVILILRLVEFRGRAQWFADHSLFWRRFGFVAFSVYAFEFVDLIAIYLLNLIPGFNVYHNHLEIYTEYQIWVAIALVYIVWALILKLWEKGHYTFSLEWMIAKLSNIFIPSKRAQSTEKLPWWQVKRLDVEGILLHPEPIHLVMPEEVNHEGLVDSILAFKLSLWGIIFFPLAFAAVIIAGESKKTETTNPYQKKAILIGSVMIAIVFLIVILSFVFTLSGIGLGGLL